MDIARVSKDAVRKEKAQLQFNLAKMSKIQEKGILGYKNSKQQQKAKTVQLINRTGELVTSNAEKAGALNSSFTSVCTSTAGLLALGPKIQAAANTGPVVSVKEE